MNRVFNTNDSQLMKYNGTEVEIIKRTSESEYDFDEVGVMYEVKFHDGYVIDVFEDELS